MSAGEVQERLVPVCRMAGFGPDNNRPAERHSSVAAQRRSRHHVSWPPLSSYGSIPSRWRPGMARKGNLAAALSMPETVSTPQRIIA